MADYNINIIDMGNSTTSQRASNVQQHSVLGEVALSQVTDDDSNPYEQMTITRVVQSEAEFNRWYRQVNKIDDTLTREVLLLPNKTVYESTGLCGSSGVVRLTYDHYPFVFQVQIDKRAKLNRFFLETELWYLLYTMVRAGSKFEKYHNKIGDVHPSNILINNDGLVKLVSTCSFPREETNFDKVLENPNKKVFLAPEELEQHSIERAEYPKNIDPSLSQCYSIGLCVLAAATLEDVDSVYSREQGGRKIQRHKLNYYLKLLGEKYSGYLHSTVMGLLADDPQDRKKCSEIYAALYEYEDKILDLESFLTTNSNSRIAQIPTNNAQHHPVAVHTRPLFQEQIVQSRMSAPNGYFHPNVVVNPIESKYVSVGPMHSQSIPGFRRSLPFPHEEPPIRIYRPSNGAFLHPR